MNTFEEYKATVKQIVHNEGIGTPLIAHSIEKVIQEFKNPDYTWRTLRGIAEETEITQTAAAMIVMALIEENVLLTKRNLNSEGNKMYSFRGHCRVAHVPADNFTHEEAIGVVNSIYNGSVGEPEELDELEQPAVVQLTAVQPAVEEVVFAPEHLKYKGIQYKQNTISEDVFSSIMRNVNAVKLRPSKYPAMLSYYNIEVCYKIVDENNDTMFYTSALLSGGKNSYTVA